MLPSYYYFITFVEQVFDECTTPNPIPEPTTLIPYYGIAVGNLKTDHIRAFDIPLPDLNIQQAITTSLMNSQAHSKKMLDLQSEKYRDLQALKSSLLDTAFKGDL